ncbi:MAG: molybdopterin-dependent oxidoreductase [Planctomycetaceae bacterium]|nr:molybdopterin-dependent oxidoreductase [Planctomycetaceae bacterium]
MSRAEDFLAEHARVTRRFFVRLGVSGATALLAAPRTALAEESTPELAEAIAKLESFLTPSDQFRDVSRGKPKPHTLSDEQRIAVGLTRETWSLEVVADPEQPALIKRPLTKADGTAIRFDDLLQLAETHRVRFPKVMTCLNIGCPLGMGIWEGVPLREILWRTEPVENLRRVFYYGYHNDDAKQMFRSSLPVGRVLEDPFGLPPVILCYKLNGEWLTPERGGPVRMVVPEAYGFKSIKWLSHILLTNLAVANDTYIEGNNDVDSLLKSFAATLSVPRKVAAGAAIPVTGYAQVGVSGVSKVQVWICRKAEEPTDDPHFETAPWVDATILPPPENGAWGGGLEESRIPADTRGFDAQGRPETWPMRLGKIHWAVLLPGLEPGAYTLRSRTVDDQGHAQPMPRPFRKSGHAAIEQVAIRVE